jgi:hypothetical protein
MTDVGNGWYRVSLTVLPVATVTHSLFFAMTNGTTLGSETYNGDGTSSIQIWGSQLNQGQLTEYQPTTSTAISLATAQNGFVTTWYDQGRYWNATRRNLLTYTEEFDNAVWLKTGVTITANSSTAPNNTLTADTMAGVAVPASTLMITRAFTTTVNVGDTYTLSCWVRNATAGITFRLTRSGAGTFEESSIAVPQSSEWQRISVTRTFANAQTGLRGDFLNTAVGDRSVEIWGAQLELGTLTDYQPILTGTPLNATQTTAANQPSIIVAGSVNSANGHPSVLYNGTTAHLSATIPLEVETTNLFVAVNGFQTLGGSTHKALLAGNGTSFLGAGTTYGFSYANNSANLGVSLGNGTIEQRVDTSNTITNVLEIIGFTRTGNSTRMLRNGVLSTAGTQNRTTGFTSGYNIGADPSSTRYYTGGISEITLFTSALSTTDRQKLERNQGAYYSISVA